MIFMWHNFRMDRRIYICLMDVSFLIKKSGQVSTPIFSNTKCFQASLAFSMAPFLVFFLTLCSKLSEIGIRICSGNPMPPKNPLWIRQYVSKTSEMFFGRLVYISDLTHKYCFYDYYSGRNYKRLKEKYGVCATIFFF